MDEQITLENTSNELNKLGQDVVDFMKDFLDSHNKVETGKLKQSVGYQLSNLGNDMFEIQIKSLPYMEQVDKGIKVKPYSNAEYYISRLKYKGNNVPPTNIYDETKNWIQQVKIPEISDAIGKDINDYIKNLFSDLK